MQSYNTDREWKERGLRMINTEGGQKGIYRDYNTLQAAVNEKKN